VPPSECEANKQPHPDLDEGMNCADRRHALVERVVVETLKRDRAVLCRPVADLTDPQPTLATTRHSLTFRVRVATPARYGRNGTALLQITSHTQQARRFSAKGAQKREAPTLFGSCLLWPRLPISSTAELLCSNATRHTNIIISCLLYDTLSLIVTRHRASTSMYSLKFRVRVATPTQ